MNGARERRRDTKKICCLTDEGQVMALMQMFSSINNDNAKRGYQPSRPSTRDEIVYGINNTQDQKTMAMWDHAASVTGWTVGLSEYRERSANNLEIGQGLLGTL